ncbi:hypothetical protein M885DRAFT_604119 [Pelagophyceae sp. CCMP2097]|nr:hypothetical protein M885DRAFT_604119 [Pelagophyceae sp. CCMP2097]
MKGLFLPLCLLGGCAGLAPGARPRGRVERRATAEAATAEAETERQIELSSAERARTAAELGVSSGAALSTIGRALPAATNSMPFTSYVDYVLDAEGAPVILLRQGAEHTLNLAADPRASVLLSGSPPTVVADAKGRGASSPRLTLVGRVAAVPADDVDLQALVANFGVVHNYAEVLLAEKSVEFSLHKLAAESVFFVGGFGVQSQWVDVSEYEDAMPDVVAKDCGTLMAKLNSEMHVDDLRIVATRLLGVGTDALLSTTVSNVDRLGVDFRVTRKDGSARTEEYRVRFRADARSLEDAKSEVVKLLQEAWELEQGLEWEGAYQSLPTVKKFAPGRAN